MTKNSFIIILVIFITIFYTYGSYKVFKERNLELLIVFWSYESVNGGGSIGIPMPTILKDELWNRVGFNRLKSEIDSNQKKQIWWLKFLLNVHDDEGSFPILGMLDRDKLYKLGNWLWCYRIYSDNENMLKEYASKVKSKNYQKYMANIIHECK